MHFYEVEPDTRRTRAAATKARRIASISGSASACGARPARGKRHRGGGNGLPRALTSPSAPRPYPWPLRRAFAPGVPELDPDPDR